jgi:hypothetical protein
MPDAREMKYRYMFKWSMSECSLMEGRSEVGLTARTPVPRCCSVKFYSLVALTVLGAQAATILRLAGEGSSW